ncbi:MAG TPA: CopD family protein [Methylomirabilota bacterium]|jgi:putative copper resistance protein D
MSLPLIAAWLVRWVGFVALAGLVGSFVVELVVLPVGVPELAGTYRRLRRLRLGCATLLLLAAGAELWLRASTMSGGGPHGALLATPVVLTRTHFGWVWSARATGLLVLLAFSMTTSPSLRSVGAVIMLGIALSVALTGHAADLGDVSVAVGIDWLHVVAAATWTGGLLALTGIVLRAATQWPATLLATVMRRFSRVAAWCLLGVVLSGGYSAWAQLLTVAALWRTTYGRVLAVKLLLVLALAWWGAVNRYLVLPRLGAGPAAGVLSRLFALGKRALLGWRGAERPAPRSELAVYLTREAILAILVFGCTALLVESTPARHAHHLEHHPTSVAPAPIPTVSLGHISR